MKKTLILFLALTLTLCLFVACTPDTEDPTDTAGNTDTEAPEETTAAETESETETEGETMDPSDPYVNDALFPDLG